MRRKWLEKKLVGTILMASVAYVPYYVSNFTLYILQSDERTIVRGAKKGAYSNFGVGDRVRIQLRRHIAAPIYTHEQVEGDMFLDPAEKRTIGWACITEMEKVV